MECGVAKKRVVILVSASNNEDEALGAKQEFVDRLGAYNIAPDGSGPEGMGSALGMAVLHGPGLVLEFAAATDEVRQAMVTLTDEPFAWPVLMNACRHEGWAMMDPESGRRFGGGEE